MTVMDVERMEVMEYGKDLLNDLGHQQPFHAGIVADIYLSWC